MSIDVGNIIDTVAGVIEPSGDRLDFGGLVLSNSIKLSIGQFKEFVTEKEVTTFFGVGSTESEIAKKYFLGFDNSTRKPKKLSFQQSYDDVQEAKNYLIGGNQYLTPEDLVLLSGSIVVSITDASDVVVTKTVALNLTTITPNNLLIWGALKDALNTAFLPVPTVTFTGDYAIDGVRPHSLLPTNGGNNIDNKNLTLTGEIADALGLSEAKGAVWYKGQYAWDNLFVETLGRLVLEHRNWVSLITTFEPQEQNKSLIAEWSNGQNDDYLYLAWCTDYSILDPAVTDDLGSLLQDSESQGTAPIYGDVEYAAFVAGAIASVDTTRPNGWADMAYKSQSGLLPNITDTTDAVTLENKGYNFYGDYASRSQNKNFLMHGVVSGAWRWIDDYIGQIYLRSGFQESALSLMTQIRRLPYNSEGYNVLSSVWVKDVIEPALEVGVIEAGIALDQTQKVVIDSLTGVDGSGEIVSSLGWFLSIEDPTAAARAARETPVIIFIYTSGQSIHRLLIPVFLAQ